MAPRGGALSESITTYVETTEDIIKAINESADAGADSVCIPVPFAHGFPSDCDNGRPGQTIHEWRRNPREPSG